jgi:hypothetical protein
MRTIIFTALALTLAAQAHAEPTRYQSAAFSATRTGYAEAPIDATHVRVTFSGNAETPREAVEAYAMYRAAEVTLTRGCDYFVVVNHDVDERSEMRRIGPPLPPIAPRGYREVTQYNAVLDIETRRGIRPVGAANAFDAREIQSSLVWRIAHQF